MLTVQYAQLACGSFQAEWTEADGTRHVERYFTLDSLQADIDYAGAVVL